MVRMLCFNLDSDAERTVGVMTVRAFAVIGVKTGHALVMMMGHHTMHEYGQAGY